MQFFHLKHAVTSVINIYSEMWELWMYLDYNPLYIPLTSNSHWKGQSCWNMGIWYYRPGTFPDNFAPDIDFIDEAVVQCYVPVVKIIF